MKQLIVLLLFFITIESTSAQTDTIPMKKNSLGLKFSYIKNHLRDKHFTPFNHEGNGGGLAYNYQSQKSLNSAIIEISGGFQYSKLDFSFLNFDDADLFAFSLKGGYLFPILNRTKWHLHIGPQVSAGLDIPLFQPGNALALSLLSEYALDLKTQFNYILGDKTTIRVSLAIPVMSLVGRPPYGTFNEMFSEEPINFALSQVKYTSPLLFQRANFSASINRNLSKKWELGFEYAWSLKNINGIYPARYSAQNINAIINYKF